MNHTIVTIPCLSDNYAYLLRDSASGATALIDAPEAAPIEAELERRGWTLDQLWITHHHNDHIGAVGALRDRFDCKVVGAAADAQRLPPLDHAVGEGDTVSLGGLTADVIDVSGHTVGHIAFHVPAAKAVFTADSLMALGCGRLFEGSAERMWQSLSKLAALPLETEVYSGHEYTASNAKFALSLDGSNPNLVARAAAITAARAQGEPTVPANLKDEIATNPFLRASNTAFKASLGMADATDAEVFAEVRARKDRF